MTPPEYPPHSDAQRRIRDELLRAIHRAPFQPFVLRRDDGRFYKVTHPETIDVPENGWSCVLALPGLGTLTIIPLRIVVAIEYPPLLRSLP